MLVVLVKLLVNVLVDVIDVDVAVADSDLFVVLVVKLLVVLVVKLLVVLAVMLLVLVLLVLVVVFVLFVLVELVWVTVFVLELLVALEDVKDVVILHVVVVSVTAEKLSILGCGKFGTNIICKYNS